MPGDDCCGRECKLGWGYNESLNLLIPIEGKPPNVTSIGINEWNYNADNLPSTDIPSWRWISLLLEPGYKKLLDFAIIFDDNPYWNIDCYLSRHQKNSEKLQKYTAICDHYVSEITYGVDLWVQFPKMGFPTEELEIMDLFQERSLNQAQKKVKCRILLNFNEIKEMTLGDLLNFMNELDKGKHSQYNAPITFEYEKLNQEIPKITISNEAEFARFLSCLYCVYRKIEIKVEETGCSNILSNMESEEKSFDEIIVNLNKAKEDYKSMDRNDFLKMYPILKRLFFCYTDYIKYSIDNMNDIHEGDYLPGHWQEIRCWFQNLNAWSPDKINKE